MATANSNTFSITIAAPPPVSWVPAQGTFANVSLNTVNDASPANAPKSNTAGPFANWSGGIFASGFGLYGALVVHGSGHLADGASLMGGVWVYDIETRLWVGRNVPSSPLIQRYPDSVGFNSYGESTTPDSLGHTYPPHTYQGLVYQSPAHGGGVYGSLIRNLYAGSVFVNCVHRFDLSSATAAPSRVIDNAGMSDSYPATNLDVARGGYWMTDYGLRTPLKFVRFSDWNITTHAAVVENITGYANLIYMPPPYDALLMVGNTGTYFSPATGFKVSRIVSGTPQPWQNIIPVGTAWPSDHRCGGTWSTLLNCVAMYEGGGKTYVHKLTPPSAANVQAGTGAWTLSRETLTGVAGATPAQWLDSNGVPAESGVLSRFIEVPSLKCFIFANSVSGPVQAWRLTGMI
jgi:hypothetical protein